MLVAALAATARAQGLAGTELSAGGLVVLAREALVGASLGIARRPGGQMRLALGLAGGARDGRGALRVEATAQFVLNPGARSGFSLYGGLGGAYLGVRGGRGEEYLTALLGLEAAAGGRSGWYLEAGLGGGARLAVGWRVRRLTWKGR